MGLVLICSSGRSSQDLLTSFAAEDSSSTSLLRRTVPRPTTASALEPAPPARTPAPALLLWRRRHTRGVVHSSSSDELWGACAVSSAGACASGGERPAEAVLCACTDTEDAEDVEEDAQLKGERELLRGESDASRPPSLALIIAGSPALNSSSSAQQGEGLA